MDAMQRLVVGVGREHHAGDLGGLRSDLAADLDAAAVGQAHVENGHVGLRGRYAGEGIGHRAGFAHHRHVLTRLEQGAQARPDDFVVVEEEHTQSHGPHLRIPSGWLRFAGGGSVGAR